MAEPDLRMLRATSRPLMSGSPMSSTMASSSAHDAGALDAVGARRHQLDHVSIVGEQPRQDAAQPRIVLDHQQVHAAQPARRS